MLHVVAVDRADVVEAELLEQRAAGHQAARILLGALGGDLDGLGEALDDLAPEMAQRAELLGGEQAREILVERADRRGDRHEIGRATCRERVCQDGWISVVAVSYKKTNKTKTLTQ